MYSHISASTNLLFDLNIFLNFCMQKFETPPISLQSCRNHWRFFFFCTAIECLIHTLMPYIQSGTDFFDSVFNKNKENHQMTALFLLDGNKITISRNVPYPHLTCLLVQDVQQDDQRQSCQML